MHATLRARRDEILRIAAKHGAGNVRVFGSMARDDADDESDVDFLIDIVGKTTPWFPGGLMADLASLLNREVDVVTEQELHSRVRERVLKEATPI